METKFLGCPKFTNIHVLESNYSWIDYLVLNDSASIF